jgi:hypothetical protein
VARRGFHQTPEDLQRERDIIASTSHPSTGHHWLSCEDEDTPVDVVAVLEEPGASGNRMYAVEIKDRYGYDLGFFERKDLKVSRGKIRRANEFAREHGHCGVFLFRTKDGYVFGIRTADIPLVGYETTLLRTEDKHGVRDDRLDPAWGVPLPEFLRLETH